MEEFLKELLKVKDKIEMWQSDLLAISDDPVKGDPMRTVRLVTDSMERFLNGWFN